MEKQPKENFYSCHKCKKYWATVDVDVGVTPYMISCLTPNCGGLAESHFYPRGQKPAHIASPDFEWFKPTLKWAKRKEKDAPGTIAHVENGGLMIRPRTDREPVYHEESP